MEIRVIRGRLLLISNYVPVIFRKNKNFSFKVSDKYILYVLCKNDVSFKINLIKNKVNYGNNQLGGF